MAADTLYTLKGVVSTDFVEKEDLNKDLKARKLATKTPKGRAF